MDAIATEIMLLAESGGVTDTARAQIAAVFHQYSEAPKAAPVAAPKAAPVAAPVDPHVAAPCELCHVWATSVAERSHLLVASLEKQSQCTDAETAPHRAQEIATARANAQGASDLVARLQSGAPLSASRRVPTVQTVLQNLVNLTGAVDAREVCCECEELLPVRAALAIVDDIVRLHGHKDAGK